MNEILRVRELGLQEYEPVWHAMRDFTIARTADSVDELWLLQHPPVFTLGQAADPQHVLAAGNIPVVRVDRGGQVTYHGPGQLIAYLLVDLQRQHLGVRQLVTLIERTLINVLQSYCIEATARADAPGVYVSTAKIAALGLRIKKGCSYHGLSLNVSTDLEPFSRINPCGFENLAVTSLQKLLSDEAPTVAQVQSRLTDELFEQLNYTQREISYSF